jgi:hypothetical protein
MLMAATLAYLGAALIIEHVSDAHDFTRGRRL